MSEQYTKILQDRLRILSLSDRMEIGKILEFMLDNKATDVTWKPVLRSLRTLVLSTGRCNPGSGGAPASAYRPLANSLNSMGAAILHEGDPAKADCGHVWVALSALLASWHAEACKDMRELDRMARGARVVVSLE